MFAGHCFCSIPGIGLYLCPDFKYFHTKHQHPLGLHNGFDHALGEPCLPVSGVLDIEKERSRTCTSKRVDKIREIHGRLRAFVAMWMRCGSARCLHMHCELKLSYISQPSFVWICIFKPHWLHAQEHPKLLCYYLGSTTCTRFRQNVISHYSHIFQICTIRACCGGFAWATSCQGLRGWLRLCDGMLNQSCRFFGVSRTTTQLSGQETRRLPWENSWMNQRFVLVKKHHDMGHSKDVEYQMIRERWDKRNGDCFWWSGKVSPCASPKRVSDVVWSNSQ